MVKGTVTQSLAIVHCLILAYCIPWRCEKKRRHIVVLHYKFTKTGSMESVNNYQRQESNFILSHHLMSFPRCKDDNCVHYSCCVQSAQQREAFIVFRLDLGCLFEVRVSRIGQKNTGIAVEMCTMATSWALASKRAQKTTTTSLCWSNNISSLCTVHSPSL